MFSFSRFERARDFVLRDRSWERSWVRMAHAKIFSTAGHILGADGHAKIFSTAGHIMGADYDWHKVAETQKNKKNNNISILNI